MEEVFPLKSSGVRAPDTLSRSCSGRAPLVGRDPLTRAWQEGCDSLEEGCDMQYYMDKSQKRHEEVLPPGCYLPEVASMED